MKSKFISLLRRQKTLPSCPKTCRSITGGNIKRNLTSNDVDIKSGDESNGNLSQQIFQMYRNPDSGLVNVGQILTVIERTGVRRTDTRLKEMMDAFTMHNKRHGEENSTVDSLNISMDTFRQLVEPNIMLVTQATRNKMVIPEFQAFCQQLTDIFKRCKKNSTGDVATYIPQLARYDPNLWGVSVCTVDGQRYSMGNVDVPFTLQSCSKPFTYAACLNELGPQIVHKYIGHEPSGRNFNEICLDREKKPHNPMLNSGAIMSCALMRQCIEPEKSLAEKYDFLLNYMRRIAGYELIGFNNAVFLSERETADRNFAMGYFLKENKCFPDNSEPIYDTMDLYFQSCSLEVNAESLAVMGATLANGGICPTTGENVLQPQHVRDVLSLMYSCGLYNYSGQFAFKVGLPAKSGVSGPILLVVPNVMSVALWSPPLDKIGNSVRGQQFCHELADLYNFHRFDNMRHSELKLDPTREIRQTKGLKIVGLLFAAVAGDVTALQRHFMSGLDMSCSDYDGRTALHLAAAEGRLDCVTFLLNTCGLEPCVKDRWGHTPLSEAERGNHGEVVDIIKEALERRS